MRIRPAAADDYESLERLWAEQSAHHVALHPTHVRTPADYLSPEAYADATRGPDHEIALIDGRDDGAEPVLGAAMLATRIMDGKYTVPRRVAHVHEIIVGEGTRRGGLGRALMSYIDRWARERGLVAVELNVWAHNEDAMAFYTALGFIPLRYEMHKRLDEGAFEEGSG